MKKLLIILILFCLASYGQVTNTKNLRIANATTEFGENIPIGTQVYNVATGELWVATASVVSTATLTTASGSFDLINSDGGGDVTGPVSSTDNAVVRFDGTTGKVIQNSSATIDDGGQVFARTYLAKLDNGSVYNRGYLQDSYMLINVSDAAYTYERNGYFEIKNSNPYLQIFAEEIVGGNSLPIKFGYGNYDATNGFYLDVGKDTTYFDTHLKLNDGIANKWLKLDANKGVTYTDIDTNSVTGLQTYIENHSDNMVYPDAGIPLSTGTAWGSSITNNSANWNKTYDWGYSAAIVLNQSANNLFAYPHATIVVNDVLFTSEQVYNGKIFRFPDLDDLTTYTSQQIPGQDSYGGLNNVCYNSVTDKIYFSSRDNTTHKLNIIEVDPDDISSYTVRNIDLATDDGVPICTDGSYIYGSNYVNSGSSTLFKISVSTWTVTATNTWTNGAKAHACVYNSNRNEFYVSTSTTSPYMAKVSTSDLTYSDVDISSYVNTVCDDICFYDDGTTCNVFMAGEFTVENYGGVMVTTTSGNALTGIDLKPSYGLFIKNKIVYSCGSGGYIQAFSATNIEDISTFMLDGITSPNELLITSNNRTFLTNYGSSANVRLMEIYIPSTNSQNVTLSGTQTITGSKTFSSDVNMVGFDVTDTDNTGYAAKIINESTFNTSGGLLVGTGLITAGADILTLTNSEETVIFNFDNDGKFRIKEDDTSPTVPSGFGTFLAKTDGKIYFKNDSQTEYDLTAGGGGGGDMYKSTYDIDEDGDIDVAAGGTEISSYTTGDLLYASGSTTLSKLTAGTDGYVLTANGAGVAPSWQAGGGGGMVYPGAGIALSTGSAWGTSITDNSSNWNTAYTDRLKWDGGSSGLTPATGRTSLGGSTIGQSMFTLTNPSAIRFPRFNADNTVSALSASDFRAAIGAGGVDVTVQSLSGLTPSWNMSNGINGKITLSGNTTITLSNVPSGYSGNLTVTNAATAYTIQFSGYTMKISPVLDSSSGVITMSGASEIDVLSWYYDGTYVIINGSFSYD